MEYRQILLIVLIIIFGVFLVYILYTIFNKISINKKEKKIDKVYNPENLVEENSFSGLNKSEGIATDETTEQKENKFFN